MASDRAKEDRFIVASVEFYPVGSYWPVVPYRVNEFQPARQPTLNLASRFVGLSIKDIVVGEYNYELVPISGTSESLPAKSGKVHVASGDNWVTVLAPQFPRGDRMGSVWGEVSPHPSSPTPLWVRLQSPFESEMFSQAKVRTDGTFIMPTVPPGRYVIIVCRGEEILLTQPLQKTPPTSQIRIDLSKGLVRAL